MQAQQSTSINEKGCARKKFYRGFVLILLLTVLICPAHGESVSLSVDPTGRTEGFSAILYNNRNGLPTADANAIAETSEGFLWIGSYAGLIRYDGNTFERLDSTNGITSIRSLFVDSRDRLWIGTNANGFAVMERGEYRIWDLRDGLKSSSIRAFAEDSSGVIYAATTSGIAMVDTDMNMTMLADPQLDNAYIRDIRLGEDGLVYGLTLPGDLFTLRDGALETWLACDDCRIPTFEEAATALFSSCRTPWDAAARRSPFRSSRRRSCTRKPGS